LEKNVRRCLSLSADGTFPVPQPPHDRKIVLIIRQDLDDDSKEVMVGEHGTGMVHLAERPEKNVLIKDMQYRIGGSLLPAVMPKRIGIEKRGDDFALFISVLRRADAPVWSTTQRAPQRTILRGHRILLALSNHRRRWRALQRRSRELGR
jgi:hypothetical protein